MASQLFICCTCGTARTFNTNTLEANAAREEFQCPVCTETGSYRPVSFTGGGYDRPHMLNIWARASSLERAAGVENPVLALRMAMSEGSVDEAEDLRDVAALIELRLHELDVAAMREDQ